MSSLIENCRRALFALPDFWLWLVIAFLTGVFCTLLALYWPKKEDAKKTNKKKEEQKQEPQLEN